MIHPGLVSVTFRALSPAQVVDLVRQAGLRGIEWGGDIHAPPGNAARAREVRHLSLEAGLSVAAYGSYYRAAQSEAAGMPFAHVLDTAGIRTDYVELASPYGHDAFLTEHRLFTPVLASFLDGLAASTPGTLGRPADALRG